MEEPDRLKQLFEEVRKAVQNYINYANEVEGKDAALLDGVLVSYELVKFDEDGDAVRSINYFAPTENFSPSGYLGLAEASRALVRQEILGWNEEEQS